MSQGDCQLESWTQGLSHSGPLPLELRGESMLQLLKQFGWHPDEVSVCHRLIELEPWYQSGPVFMKGLRLSQVLGLNVVLKLRLLSQLNFVLKPYSQKGT